MPFIGRDFQVKTFAGEYAINLQAVAIVEISAEPADPALREQIRKVSSDQVQITDVSLLLALCTDLKARSRDAARYWRCVTRNPGSAVFLILQYYGGREQVWRDEAMRSRGIAEMPLMLAAREMGYDSCPMDLSEFDEVGRLINLTEDHVASCSSPSVNA